MAGHEDPPPINFKQFQTMMGPDPQANILIPEGTDTENIQPLPTRRGTVRRLRRTVGIILREVRDAISGMFAY